MKLKGRLGLIANKVPLCKTVCDIGTDHARIPLFIASNNISSKVVATDARKGPVLAAKENIRRSGMEGIVETRLGYGLDVIDSSEIDVIIIAGMGGELIGEILERGIDKAKIANLLIIQPMNAIEKVRKWLYENGFDITDEELACEEGKLYNVILSRWTGSTYRPDEIYFHIGEKLIEKRDPMLAEYIEKKILQHDRILEGMKKKRFIDAGSIERCKRRRHALYTILEKMKRW